MPVKEKHHKIDPDVAEILRSRITCEGNQLVITGPRLEPKMYQRVNKTLEMLGGKWKGGKTQAHVFPDSPKTIIAAAIGSGKVLNRKQTYQFFETPKDLAARMVRLADIHVGDRVLEPSAGRGAIVSAIYAAGLDCLVDAVEIDGTHRDTLSGIMGAEAVFIHDFLEFQPAEAYDRVVMNPPFSGLQDADHVRHAYSLLKPGGKLVAIMSFGPFEHTTAKAAEFRGFYRDVGWEHEEELPAGTFSESGTDVSTKLIVITKPN